ncbi:MAG: tetratricopeptide repeat protein [Chloroflexota bacterium]
MTELPSGTVTFLFTDIEGSTRLLESDAVAYRTALERHNDLLRRVVARCEGAVFKETGDGFCAAFANPSDAVSAALKAQIALHAESWETAEPVRVRMAIHTGEVQRQGAEYFGLPLHRSARLMESAHGGQVVLSASTEDLISGALPEGVALRDLGQHRLRDLATAERIYGLTAPGLPDEFPLLRTLTAVPNNLPRQVTPFIGREHQIRAIRDALFRPGTRLLTLTGPGGTGKTRLAQQAAAEALDDFPDGAWFVPLAALTDPGLVASTIAQALGVREASGRPIADSLVDYVRSRQLLLVLDNFEQIAAAAPLVSELIAAAPGVRVLVTSRALLQLYGEREYSVPPLTLPDHRRAPSADHLAQFEAVRLFVDRAQTARADFTLTDTNATDVAEICHRLDGLPLAIELAAARIRTLTPRAIVQRMEQRLPLLTGGARDLPARQRTLRDAIGWSYDLLEPAEQTLFRRLAVFHGCTLDAAESVCAGEPARSGATSVALVPLGISVLDGIESLLQKSLLRQQESVDDEPWYVMLETVREYALERLAESDEASAVHRRHVLAAIHLVESGEAELAGRQQAAWFARLEQEHGNIRSALNWSEERGYGAPALRLSVALWWFWVAHGHAREGLDRLTRLIERFHVDAPSPRLELYAKALYATGMLASAQGDHNTAQLRHEAGLSIRRSLDDPASIFGALEGLGTVASLAGDFDSAHEYLEEALSIARELDDPVRAAMALHALGNVRNELGDLGAARAYYEESLAVLPADTPLVGPQLSIAAMALDQGHYEEAASFASIALARFRRDGNPHPEALALATLGGIALAGGDRAAARQHFVDSLAILLDLGNVPGVAQVLDRFAALVLASGSPADALRVAGSADALRERGGGPRAPRAGVKLAALLESTRSALSPEAAERAWQEGRLLDLEAAVDAALAISIDATSDRESQPGLAPAPTGNGSVTPREREVAILIARGLTNRQIAETLVITEGTAANHVVHILNKLGFSSRAQVASWATANHLTLDEPSG